MVVNLVDSVISMPPSGGDVVNVCWHAGSPLPFFLPPGVGCGSVSLMRIIAPHKDLGLLATLLGRALPSLRHYFVPNGWIEIYGSKVSTTIDDSPNVIGGALRGDNLQTIGGALHDDTLYPVEHRLSIELSRILMGAECLYVRP